MNADLQKYLIDKYPKILGIKEENVKHCYGMFGFECGDGWFLHLDRMFSHIQSEIDYSESNYENLKYMYNKLSWYRKIHSIYKRSRYHYLRNKQTPIPQVTAVQIKQKFGTLRFYYTGGDERIAQIVEFYELYTQYICEDCGTNVDVGYTSGWIRNICEKHVNGSKRTFHNAESTELFNKIVNKK